MSSPRHADTGALGNDAADLDAVARLCRYWSPIAQEVHIGVVVSGLVYSLTALDPEQFSSYTALIERDDLATAIGALDHLRLGEGLPYDDLDREPRLTDFHLLAPITKQEVWGAGETYERPASKRANASPFDRAFFADRPELFFKATPNRVVGPNEPIRVRRDAALTFPEPELVLVMNSKGHIVAFTIGNDVTAYDLCDDNLLYMPQVKTYQGCCSLGPTLVLADTVDYRSLTIDMTIERAGVEIFTARTDVHRLVRPFGNLRDYLFREQRFAHGVMLMTGLGFDLPRGFTVSSGDLVEITMPPVGRLRNTVA